MKRDFLVFLDDILESIARIKEYTKGMNEEEFLKNVPTQDAVIRRLEIIGEAVKNIPQHVRDKHSDIPWKEIAGTRDIITHEYFGVNLERIWKTIKEDLPPLKEGIEKIF